MSKTRHQKRVTARSKELTKMQLDCILADYPNTNYRQFLKKMYYKNGYGFFKGKVLKFDRKKGFLFKYLYCRCEENINDFIEGTENHVWINDRQELQKSNVFSGECISFYATVYPYYRDNGTIDFSLKEVKCVEKICQYSLPDINLDNSATIS